MIASSVVVQRGTLCFTKLSYASTGNCRFGISLRCAGSGLQEPRLCPMRKRSKGFALARNTGSPLKMSGVIAQPARPRFAGRKYCTYIASTEYVPLRSTFAGTPPGVNTTSLTGFPETSTSRPPTWNEPMSRRAMGAEVQAVRSAANDRVNLAHMNTLLWALGLAAPNSRFPALLRGYWQYSERDSVATSLRFSRAACDLLTRLANAQGSSNDRCLHVPARR